MTQFILKYKILFLIVVIIIGMFLLVKENFYSKPQSQPVSTPVQQQDQLNESPKIISTKPDPLENTIVSANEVVEITFNKPLQNPGEFKLRIEPKIDYKVELSGDRKTAKIIPLKGYALSTTYTIFIGPDTKFDGSGSWGQEKIFHYKTITYRGV